MAETKDVEGGEWTDKKEKTEVRSQNSEDNNILNSFFWILHSGFCILYSVFTNLSFLSVAGRFRAYASSLAMCLRLSPGSLQPHCFLRCATLFRKGFSASGFALSLPVFLRWKRRWRTR